MLDEVLALVLRKWPRDGRGFYLLVLASDEGERRPRTLSAAARRSKHLAPMTCS